MVWLLIFKGIIFLWILLIFLSMKFYMYCLRYNIYIDHLAYSELASY